jgi:hypothetical protein
MVCQPFGLPVVSMEGEDDDSLEDDEGPDFRPISVYFMMSKETTMP